MKVGTENDNNFGYEKITILVDNMLLNIRAPKHPPDFSAAYSENFATYSKFYWQHC